jgi:hypothetical protein
MKRVRKSRRVVKEVSEMSNTELQQALKHRSMMYSWVAFIDESESKAIKTYISEATDGLLEVEKEMHLREIPGKWH